MTCWFVTTALVTQKGVAPATPPGYVHQTTALTLYIFSGGWSMILFTQAPGEKSVATLLSWRGPLLGLQPALNQANTHKAKLTSIYPPSGYRQSMSILDNMHGNGHLTLTKTSAEHKKWSVSSSDKTLPQETTAFGTAEKVDGSWCDAWYHLHIMLLFT